jgi:hypothetical protein
MIDGLMRFFFGWYINRIIERCARVCEKNSVEADEYYRTIREVASSPDSDFGVLKYVCYAGQASRDAYDIRTLTNA